MENLKKLMKEQSHEKELIMKTFRTINSISANLDIDADKVIDYFWEEMLKEKREEPHQGRKGIHQAPGETIGEHRRRLIAGGYGGKQ